MNALKCAMLALLAALPVGAIAQSQQLWFSDTTEDAVHVVDAAGGAFLGQPIAFPAHQPLAPVVSPKGSHVYVQSAFGAIADIDVATQTIAQTFDDPTPDAIGIRTLTISPDGRTLYATGPDATSIAYVDTADGAVKSRVDISSLHDASPLLRASHDGKSLFLLDSYQAKITKIDVATQTTGPTVGVPTTYSIDGLVWMTLSDDDQTLYTATKLGSCVTIDATSMTIRESKNVASYISGLIVAPHGEHAFLTTTDDACLVDLDLSTGNATSTAVADDSCSFPLAVTDDGSELLLVEHNPSDQSETLLGYQTDSRGVRFDHAGYSYLAFDDQSLAHGAIVPATGLWWNPAESGRSFSIEVQNGDLVLVAMGYDESGAPSWQVASGAYDAAGAAFHAQFGRYEGGQCFGCAYGSATFVAENAGDVTLTFSSPTDATLIWDGHAIPITKYSW
jgi:hypothetical protein